MRTVTTRALIGLALLAAAAGGCASAGYEKAAAAQESMAALSQGIEKSGSQIDATLKALQALPAAGGGDLKPLFKKFSDELATLDDMAAAAKSRAKTMRSQGDAYFASWEKESEQYRSEQMKKLSEERRMKVKESFAKLTGSAEAAGSAYGPFSNDLRDIHIFLSNDLTAAGVKSLEGSIKKANEDGAKVKTALASMSTELDRVKAEFSAGEAPKK